MTTHHHRWKFHELVLFDDDAKEVSTLQDEVWLFQPFIFLS
jgi:hypothetical protein